MAHVRTATSNVEYRHHTIEMADKICISQRAHATCIRQPGEPTEWISKSEQMACFDKSDEQGRQYWEEAIEGKRLYLTKRATDVMQIQVPTKCGSKEIDSQLKRRSNWLPIMRQNRPIQEEDNEWDQPKEENAAYDQWLSQEQEKKWFDDVKARFDSYNQQVKEIRVQSGDAYFHVKDLHHLMGLTNEQYERFEKQVKKVAERSEVAEWFELYELPLQKTFDTLIQRLIAQIGSQYREPELKIRTVNQLRRVTKRVYMYMVEQMLAEYDQVPRDGDNRPLRPTTGAMIAKVWYVLRHELTADEVRLVERDVERYMQKVKEERPVEYESKMQLPTKYRIVKNEQDARSTVFHVLKIAQAAIRLAADEKHEYSVASEYHQKWLKNDEAADREYAKAQRWLKANQEQKTTEWDKMKLVSNKKYESQDEEPAFEYEQDQEQPEYDDKEGDRDSLFDKLKFAIRSFEKKTIGRFQN